MEDQMIDEVLAEPQENRVPPLFQWRLKNVVGSIEMPGLQESNGVPVKLHSLRIKSNLQDILDDLIDQFQRQGLFMRDFPLQEQPVAQTQVTAFDPHRLISYTAIIECIKSQVCTVVLGEANIELGVANAKQRSAQDDFAPLPPGAAEVQRSRAENYETLAFTVAASTETIKKFYVEALARQGYVKKAGRERWQRKGEAIQLVVPKGDGSARTTFMLTHSRGGLETEEQEAEQK